MLRIRDVYPDPNFFNPGSRIRFFSIPDPGSASKNLSILTQKKWFLTSRKYDPGCSSRIRNFYPSRVQGSKRHRIPDPQHWYPKVKAHTSVTMLVWASGAWLEPAMAATSIFTRLPHSASEDSVSSSSKITQHHNIINNRLITQHHNEIKEKPVPVLRALPK